MDRSIPFSLQLHTTCRPRTTISVSWFVGPEIRLLLPKNDEDQDQDGGGGGVQSVLCFVLLLSCVVLIAPRSAGTA